MESINKVKLLLNRRNPDVTPNHICDSTQYHRFKTG